MTDSRGVILPTFSGKNDDFQVWWTKFRAFATAKGVIDVLLGTENDMPVSERAILDDAKPAEKLMIKARERNSLAMAYLLSAFTQEADISLAYEAMEDPDWPGGLAFEVVTKLLQVYQPKDKVTTVELYEKLLKVTMKKKEDPKALFEQVAKIQNWYNSGSKKKVDIDQLIAVVMKAAPREYASVLNAEQRTQGEDLKLSHIRIAMNQYFRSVYGSEKTGSEKDELTLAAKTGNKGNNKKFAKSCNNCGKKYHMAKDCREDPKNADKRPAWYKKADEVAAAANTKNASNELQLTNISWGAYAEAFEEDDDDFENEIALFEQEKATRSSHNEASVAPITETKTETLLKAAVANRNRNTSLLYDPEIFVLDTGATTHSTGNSKGLINIKKTDGFTTTVGNGQKVSTTAVAELPFKMTNGSTGTINRVHLIPGAPFNLISGTKLLGMGFQISGNQDQIVYSKDEHNLKFDIRIDTPEGFLLAIRLTRTGNEVGGVANTTKTVSIMQAHTELGHMDETVTRKAATELGWTITRGTMKKCESCARGKAKQKKVHSKNVPNVKHEEVHGRVYLDQSRIVKSTKDKSIQPIRPYWTLMVDENTAMKTTIFTESKAKMYEPVCLKMKAWKEKGKEVKIIRMDNGGENKGLVKVLNSAKWQMYPDIEYTARDTPQHNHLVEVGFATLYGRSRALIIAANVPNNKKHIVGQKAIETVTKLDGLIPITIKGITKLRVDHAEDYFPLYAHHLRTWGEAGTVKIKTTTTPKLGERALLACSWDIRMITQVIATKCSTWRLVAS
jgi:hypothetical protein